jgi:hypothetical protein
VETPATVTPGIYPPRRWPWVVGALVGVAVIAAAVWYIAIRSHNETNVVHGPADAPFTVTVPAGWRSLSPQELTTQPGSPVAVLQREDGNGVVTIHIEPGTNASNSQLAKRLEAELKRSIPDFKLVNSGTVKVQAGSALSISYARTKQGTANTLLVIPSSGRLYTLNAAVPAGQTVAAQGAGQILSSFDL